MLIRARLKLECARCGESKLISVTIIDDATGPAICDECVARAMIARRSTRSVTATPTNGPAYGRSSSEAARPEDTPQTSANPSKAA
jgi:hypothetical protein